MQAPGVRAARLRRDQSGGAGGSRGESVTVVNGSDRLGGDAKVTLGTVKALTELGIPVHLVSVGGEVADAVTALELGPERVTIVPGPGRGVLRRFSDAVVIAVVLWSTLIRHRPAVIYTAPRTIVPPIAMSAALVLRIPYVVHLHHFGNLRRQLRYRTLVRRAAGIWCISEFILARAKSVGLRNLHLIHNCLPQDEAELHTSPDEAREKLGLPPIEGCLVACVARLSPYKGQEFIIRAMAHPDVRCRAITCCFAGIDTGEGALAEPARPDYDGYLRDLCSRLGVEDRVYFLGQVPGRSVFAGADFAALVADAEPFGLTALEAQEQGCPVIGTASGATPEIVLDDETGLLVPPGDVSALAMAIVRLHDEPETRHRLAKAGRERLSLFSYARYRNRVGVLLEDQGLTMGAEAPSLDPLSRHSPPRGSSSVRGLCGAGADDESSSEPHPDDRHQHDERTH